jgi:fatty-acyl-CoA synthase
MTLPLTPIRFLYRAADLFARRVGIVCGDKEFTYGQFAERGERLAGQLLALGVEPGDRVAYISFNTHLLLEGYYGVVMAGGIVMPLNVRLTPGEITGILNHSGARIVFYEAEFAGMVRSLECPAVAHWIQLDQFALEAPPARCDWTKIDENQVAELFYTSGSTGTPKGVSLTHRTLYLHAMSLATTFDDPKTKVDLHTIPLFHANGWGMPQACAMMGTKQVMVRRFDPAAVLALIAEHKATDMCLVPTMANALLNCPQLGQFDTSSLRHIMLGGAASSPELIARLEAAFGCEAAAGYGLTETAPVLSKAGPKPGVVFADEADRQRRQRPPEPHHDPPRPFEQNHFPAKLEKLWERSMCACRIFKYLWQRLHRQRNCPGSPHLGITLRPRKRAGSADGLCGAAGNGEFGHTAF